MKDMAMKNKLLQQDKSNPGSPSDSFPRHQKVPSSRAGSFAPIDLPGISVIIPAHNEEHYLGPTLEALRSQTYPWIEVIVVANACADRTLEVARHRCDRLLNLEERSLGRARNLGGRKARGDLLVFLDADTILQKNALEIIAREFNPTYSMGTLRGAPDTKLFSHRFVYWLKNMLHSTKIHYGSSGIIICWRDYFKAVGGFDDNLEIRENSHLMKRLRAHGKYKYLSRATAITSMRRYQKLGFLKITALWIKIQICDWFCGLRNRTYDVIR
jgi:glycosyltransferase involved in cell wall biosynthesis